MEGRLTLRHLEIFRAVCEHGGASAAARALGIAQPSVSQAVRELEERFHVALFDRVSRRMDLTPDGARLLEHAREVLDDLDDLERSMGEKDVGALRVASSVTSGTRHLPRAVARLADALPLVEVSVRVEDSAGVERDVLANRADVGLVEGLVHSADIVSVPFAHDELVVVAPPDLASAPRSAAELASGRLLLRERGSGVRELLEATLAERGLTVAPAWESASTEALKAAVREGLGLSVLPLGLVERELGDGSLRRVEVADLELGRDLLLIRHRRKTVTPAMEALRRALGGA